MKFFSCAQTNTYIFIILIKSFEHFLYFVLQGKDGAQSGNPEWLVQRSCISLIKCSVDDKELCAYNHDDGKFSVVPNKCVLLQLNCKRKGRK